MRGDADRPELGRAARPFSLDSKLHPDLADRAAAPQPGNQLTREECQMSLRSARRGSLDPRRAIIGGRALVVVSGAWAISYLVVQRARVGQLSIGELGG